MYIIGNNQRGDTICGRHVYYGTTAKRISRMCTAGPNQYLQPKHGNCKRLLMSDVADNFKINNTEYLHKLYQNSHWNAWFELDYGGNPEGIFNAVCPHEAPHALGNEIFMHLLKKLIQRIITKKAC